MLLFALLFQLPDPNDLSGHVEMIRTAYGVPHIRAQDLKAFGYGLAWIQLEDYGATVAQGLLRERGTLARVFGHDSIESDFLARHLATQVRGRYAELDQPTRDVYEGFAAGINRYVRLHPGELPAGFPADFSGYDVATRDVEGPGFAAARRYLARIPGALAAGRPALPPGE